ncbi:Ubiquitin carboxyl-terminal hydrolase MINDY-1 [Geodia barretti]|uniref:Ubiquitin carboxyl-terminal hydrolase n=1 Tax=Geodia barretti TaxID=519541 RepID=A0AA35REQ4_GEOBA|nr:Ubiquitin carboxyl-terminal hydrolase MINDY-1 [Geodia barretti]
MRGGNFDLRGPAFTETCTATSPSPSLVCLMSETTTEGEKPDCGGGGGESRDLGPMATPVDGDAATVDGDGGRETTPADSTSIYQLKWVEWKGGFVPVITQNENGPCPLLALCNVLLLTDRMKLVAGETVVTSTALMDLLGTAIIENMPQDLSEGERANYEQNIQDAMASFPKLQTGLDVNVRFDSVKGFEFTSEIVIFDLLNVPLYHGWLPDPQEKEMHSLVHTCSYNQLVEMVISGQSEGDPNILQRALTVSNMFSILQQSS